MKLPSVSFPLAVQPRRCLPRDNLKPRRKNIGIDLHQSALEQQHKPLMLVHKHLKREKKKKKKKERQADYAKRKSDDVQLEVGGPV